MPQKALFINSEIWILVFGGAFQRANVYKENISENQRKEFREFLMGYVDSELLPQYKTVVNEDAHIQNIESLIAHANQKAELLKENRLRFGVAQKIVNLFLKYHWCLGNIECPPHFPVDRIIQGKLKIPITAWTEMDDVEQYKEIINFAKEKASAEGLSLAQWELQNFSRRFSIA
ncbi:hypothetical protein [Sphingobacterium wenxiniae]|uniref:Uncharacterized protein n=1 Tax=Sphingobacterium wenxiniae TaxID=683125 RepID=A0A1I6TGL9_9SPHI|nr:hypothetical protein [Sphingobacterium wenxiniae]SFS88335.1 hypothetical protein SAMN05660206_106138 [Sphingobacterium wenxiniae]HLV47315.1 hypothetical protein [Flavobacterium sp.]